MRPILTSGRLTTQPRQELPVDWGNRLTRGLVAFWYPVGDTMVSAVPGNLNFKPLLGSVSPQSVGTIGHGPRELAFKNSPSAPATSAGVGALIAASATARYNVAVGQAGYSAFIMGTPPPNGGAGVYTPWLNFSADASTQGWQIYANGDDGLLHNIMYKSGSNEMDVGGASVSSPQLAGFSYDAVNSILLCFTDGIVTGLNNTSTGGTILANQSALNLLEAPSSASMVALWNRPLSRMEAREFSKNPWALLKASNASRWALSNGNSYAAAGADSVSATDAATSLETMSGTAADAVSASDVVSQQAILPALATDPANATDAGSSMSAATGSATDSISATDASDGPFSTSLSASDSVSSTDTSSQTAYLINVASDGVNAADAATDLASQVSSATDSVSASDASSQNAILLGNASDSVTAVDTSSSGGSASLSAADTASAADLATSVAAAASTASDSVTASDSSTQFATLTSSASDAVTASDSSDGQTAHGVQAADAASASDAAANSGNFALSVSDAVSSIDSALIGGTTLIATDSVSTTDAASVLGAAGLTAVDSVSATDASTSGQTAYQLSVSDALLATDSASALLPPVASGYGLPYNILAAILAGAIQSP